MTFQRLVLSFNFNDACFITEEETPTQSTVLGRPVLLALEDVDGAPSFLEKALRFVEDHGTSFRLLSIDLLLSFLAAILNTSQHATLYLACRSQDRRNLETSC